MQAAPPEEAGVTAGISISADVGQGRAAHGLKRTAALHRSGVKQEKIITCSGALCAEDAEEPFDDLPKTGPALVIGVLAGKAGKEMPELSAGRPKKAAVRRYPHKDLGHGQSDDLGIARPSASVSPSLWQKIIRCAINDRAEGVQVGVHRGLRVDGVAITVGFGPSALNPFIGDMFVASII
jgi:hypothetical protein